MLGKKTGGRAKGTPNKLTATVRERLEQLGCDPIQGMADIAMDPETEPELRGRMYSELSQYVFPKRKAVEHSGVGGGPIEHSVSGAQLLADRIAGIAARATTDGGTGEPDK